MSRKTNSLNGISYLEFSFLFMIVRKETYSTIGTNCPHFMGDSSGPVTSKTRT